VCSVRIDKRRFVKEDTEHDIEMEKLFSERMRAAQLEIDRLAAEAAITPGAGSPAFRRKAGCDECWEVEERKKCQAYSWRGKMFHPDECCKDAQ
jgi:hypothetical protein